MHTLERPGSSAGKRFRRILVHAESVTNRFRRKDTTPPTNGQERANHLLNDQGGGKPTMRCTPWSVQDHLLEGGANPPFMPNQSPDDWIRSGSSNSFVSEIFRNIPNPEFGIPEPEARGTCRRNQ